MLLAILKSCQQNPYASRCTSISFSEHDSINMFFNNFFFFFVYLQFKAFAVVEGGSNAETPMEIVVNVIDQNDNNPIFEKDTYLGEVAEASPRSTVCDSSLCHKICAS